MRYFFLLLIFLNGGTGDAAGLELDREPQEKLYTRQDIEQNNRNPSAGYCLCVNTGEAGSIISSSSLPVVSMVPRSHSFSSSGGNSTSSSECPFFCNNDAPSSSIDIKSSTSASAGANKGVGRIIQWRLGNLWPLFVWDHKGPRNSNHLADPFTITHVSHGVLFFAIWAVLLGALLRRRGSSKNSPCWRWWWYAGMAVMAVLEATWELVENNPRVIVRFRAGGISRDYYGDAGINMFGDWCSAMLGYFVCLQLSRRYGTNRVIRWGLLLFAISEVALVLYQRDCMTLIIIQLVCHPEWLVDFQSRESFADIMLKE